MKPLLPILAQRATQVPDPARDNSVDLTNWWDILIFIVLPIAVVVVYFVFRKRFARAAGDVEGDNEDEKEA